MSSKTVCAWLMAAYMLGRQLKGFGPNALTGTMPITTFMLAISLLYVEFISWEEKTLALRRGVSVPVHDGKYPDVCVDTQEEKISKETVIYLP